MAILQHERIVEDGSEPVHWLYVLHGIFGAGRNWGSVARRVIRARPEWGALLVDLREHGGSRGFAPPHTLDAAAADVAELAAHTETPPAALLGHSFGGKVALRFAAGAESGRSTAWAVARSALRQVWVVDSTPAASAAGGSAWTMLNLIRSMPDRFASRDQLTDALVGHGLAPGVAQWMATNLEPLDGGGYRWRFDLNAMDALLHSFYETDAWSAVESPPADVQVHMVRAASSSVLSGETLERVERATGGGRVQLHTVAGGHWVNAENPAAIEDLLVRLLPAA